MYTTWHNYGYGVCTTGIAANTTVDKIERLLELAPKFKEEMKLYFEEANIIDPRVDNYVRYDESCRYGIASVLQEVIEEAEGIEFCACDDLDSKCYLIYSSKYPWELTEKDMSLTEEKLGDILKKYISILTNKEITIEYQTVANGG